MLLFFFTMITQSYLLSLQKPRLFSALFLLFLSFENQLLILPYYPLSQRMGLLPLCLLPEEEATFLLRINGLMAAALHCKLPDGVDYKEKSFISIFTLDWQNLALTHLPLIKILTFLFILTNWMEISETEGCPKYVVLYFAYKGILVYFSGKLLFLCVRAHTGMHVCACKHATFKNSQYQNCNNTKQC